MIRARKRFGQHFLEPGWATKLVAAIGPQPDEIFLEIGPGRGALTLPLAAAGARIVAIEIDRDLAGALASVAPEHVAVVAADFLTADVAGLLAAHTGWRPGSGATLRVVGNLPYNVSSPILFRLIDLWRSGVAFADATLMLQRELAARLVARAGSGEYGPLAIVTGLYADRHLVVRLPPGAFRPPPRVRSALVRLTFRPPPVAPRDPALFGALVRSLFTRRRKTLLNALRPFAAARGVPAAAALAAAGLAAGRRPETLQLSELVWLADVFASAGTRAVL